MGRHELDRHLENAAAIGFATREIRFEPVPGKPMVIGTTDGQLDLELGVYDRTPEGAVCFYVPDGDGRLLRISLSDGVFDHPTSFLDGTEVRTVSPLAL